MYTGYMSIMFAIYVAIECDAGPSSRSLWGHLAPGQGEGGEETPTLSKCFCYNTMIHLRSVPNGTVRYYQSKKVAVSVPSRSV